MHEDRHTPAADSAVRDVVILGPGGVGQALLRMIAAGPPGAARLRVVAAVDRSGMVIDTAGLSPERLLELAEAKRRGETCSSLRGGIAVQTGGAVADLLSRGLRSPIAVDLTAGETTPLLTELARAGFGIVLANKRPLTAPLAEYRALVSAAPDLRHEATVGAGLPTVVAVRQLVDSGDTIRAMEGALSGTLGVVMTAVEDGVPLSEAVRDAHSRGYTEPDPRDDLSGMDVARKALILARMTGADLDLPDFPVEPLVPIDWEMPLDDWWQDLASRDGAWRERSVRARDAGEVYRYAASVTGGAVTVGVRRLPVDHPLGQLRGSASRLVISSARYPDQPLVITGPGAGAEVTATGVMADLMALSLR